MCSICDLNVHTLIFSKIGHNDVIISREDINENHSHVNSQSHQVLRSAQLEFMRNDGRHHFTMA